ncbi:MAG: hypothetical protein QXK12_02995 [Candidatus Nezhaarchaeales archaeon]
MASSLGLDCILPYILRKLKARDKAKDKAIELARAIIKLSGGLL